MVYRGEEVSAKVVSPLWIEEEGASRVRRRSRRPSFAPAPPRRCGSHVPASPRRRIGRAQEREQEREQSRAAAAAAASAAASGHLEGMAQRRNVAGLGRARADVRENLGVWSRGSGTRKGGGGSAGEGAALAARLGDARVLE